MSVAAVAPALQADQDRYLGVAKTARAAGRSVSWTLQRAVIGSIRTRVTPGRPPTFHLGDAIRASQSDHAEGV